MSIMAESSSYNSHHAERQQLYPHEWTSSTNWTPQSAVSSFNYPQQCDSSLMTPVSTAASAPSRLAPIKQESPPSTTPTSNYHYFSPDEEYLNGRPKNTMKYKGPLAHLPPTSNDLPLSPLDVPTPYWGPYCVSANTTNSHHSPTLNSSPSLNASAGTQSAPSSYRVSSQTPILIAPTPQALRPANRYTDDLIRQNSFDSGHSSTPRSAHIFQGSGHSPFLIDQEVIGPLPQGRKRRSTSRRGDDGDRSDSNSEKSRQDALLVQLRNYERRQWKEVRDKFNETTGLAMKIPALEMRLKRYKERSRPWTEVDDNALALSHAEVSKNVWKMVADGMLKHGVSEVWPKDTVKRKWEDSNFDETGPPRLFHGELRHQKRRSRDRESSSWSLESPGENGIHEGEDASMSAGGIDDNRSRVDNGNNTHYQQGSQHQTMNEEKP